MPRPTNASRTPYRPEPAEADPLSRRAGQLVRQARIAGGLSQVALAERAGVARQTLVLLEAGRLRPRLDTLAHLADALGLSPTLLVVPDVAAERARLHDAIDRLPDSAVLAAALLLVPPAAPPPTAPPRRKPAGSRIRRR